MSEVATTLNLPDQAELESTTDGIHKGCGGMVARVRDDKNWPTEAILICQHCHEVVFQNDIKQRGVNQ